MKLKCKINGVEYDKIVSGSTFSDEYNETLDSGAIKLDHIGLIPKLRPLDDVYIWDSSETGHDHFNGYYNKGDLMNIDTISTQETLITQGEQPFTIRNGNTGNNQTPVSIYQGKTIRGVTADIWAYLMMNTTSSNADRLNRYKVPEIRLNFVLYNVNSGQTIMRKYSLPTTFEGINPDGMENILRLERYTEGSPDTPYYLYINFTRKISDFEKFLVDEKSMGGITLEGLATGELTVNGVTTSYTYSISSIELISGYDYGYQECEDSETKTTVSLINDGTPEFQENYLTRDKLLTVSNLTLTGMIKGRLFEMPLESVGGAFNNGVYFIFEKSFQYYDTNNNVAKSILARAYVFLYPDANIANKWVGTSDLCLIEQVQNNEYDMSDLDYGYQSPMSTPFHYWFDTVSIDFENAMYEMLQSQTNLPKFFKHLVVDKYTREMVDLDKTNFKYKIDLKSEISKLEKVILPNISITQPIAVGVPKRSIRYYLEQYVNLYSPKYKKALGHNKWAYVQKYSLDDSLWDIFTDDVYAPEMTLTAPTLRELLSRLMIVKDCIPYVFNDVIYAIDISKTYGNVVTNPNHFNFVYSSMESSSYSTALRREFQGAISQKNTAHMVEYLGFRNSGSALLTLENMELQTRFPIYKINKMYMCYYRKVRITKHLPDNTTTQYDKIIFVKQDITDLVLQNNVRNTLPADWTQYGAVRGYNDMKKYKLLTVGFDIGSNKITGWGEKFSYYKGPLAWTQVANTYIETIMNFLDMFFPYGIGRENFLEANESVNSIGPWNSTTEEILISPIDTDGTLTDQALEENNITAKLKTLVFQIDYNAMYSGTIIHSKDNEDEDDYTTTDNSNTSLSLLEVDGLYQKEKVNRLANPTKSWVGRFDNYEQMHNTPLDITPGFNARLGAIFDDESGEEPVIVYHREYQIWEDCVICNFVGMYDYVMKNYYTNVFAKYRTYSYASYDQSVERKENDKYSIRLSKSNQYYEEGSIPGLSTSMILSAFEETTINQDLTISYENQINGGYFSFEDGNEYFSDVNVFVSGYSLCFNIRMFDVLTTGIELSSVNCFDKREGQTGRKYVGSAQQWYVMPVESEADGFLKTIGCYFGHFKDEDIIYKEANANTSATDLYNDLLKLPYKKRDAITSFGKKYDYCKDNKELIDYTLQYEVVNYNNDSVAFSDWLLKLSEFNNYVKLTKDKKISVPNYANSFRYCLSTAIISNIPREYKQILVFIFKNDANDEPLIEINNQIFGAVNSLAYSYRRTIPFENIDIETNMYVSINNFVSLENDTLTANITLTIETNTYYLGRTETRKENYPVVLNFTKVTDYAYAETGYSYFVFNERPLAEFISDPAPSYAYKLSNGKFFTVDNVIDSNSCEIKYASFTGNGNKIYTYPKTMYLVASKNNIEKTMLYPQLKLGNLPSNYQILQIDVNEVFKMNVDSNGSCYISFDSTLLFELSNEYKSIQYWYYDYNVSGYGNNSTGEDDDGNEYAPEFSGDGLLHFVFGIDLTRVSNVIQSEKVYVSTVKNRNKKVFNAMHEVIGHVANCADDTEAEYGEQKYVLNEEE